MGILKCILFFICSFLVCTCLMFRSTNKTAILCYVCSVYTLWYYRKITRMIIRLNGTIHHLSMSIAKIDWCSTGWLISFKDFLLTRFIFKWSLRDRTFNMITPFLKRGGGRNCSAAAISVTLQRGSYPNIILIWRNSPRGAGYCVAGI